GRGLRARRLLHRLVLRGEPRPVRARSFPLRPATARPGLRALESGRGDLARDDLQSSVPRSEDLAHPLRGAAERGPRIDASRDSALPPPRAGVGMLCAVVLA